MRVTLVCPFCDESAQIIPGTKKIVSPGKVYTKRRCIMGHEVWSVEEIPENQAKVVNEIQKIREYRKEQKLKAMRARMKAKKKKK